MLQPRNSSDLVFGFLSTLLAPQYGYFGGYLLLSVLGRPLEFHCTAPVRPSRAQEILYGPTLDSYLLGEQIGGTLLREAQIAPHIVLTDRAATLCLRSAVGFPVLLVAERVASTATAVPSDLPLHPRFIAGGYELESAAGYTKDHVAASELLDALAKYVDLAEPFDRIHEAIQEAQRLGERSQESYGQAAA
jgi:hypothetical protein